jgi:hypothetical protein
VRIEKRRAKRMNRRRRKPSKLNPRNSLYNLS